MNIVLIGFKSAGKSTVAKLLAKRLNRSFIDIDDTITEIYEEKYSEKLTVREIYIKLGDAGFRVLEKEVTQTLCQVVNSVIAAGGGTVCDPSNVKVLKKHGWLVYLDVPIEVLRKRILEDSSLEFLDVNHPARRFEKTYHERQIIYKEIADLMINTENKTTEEIVNMIKESYYGQ